MSSNKNVSTKKRTMCPQCNTPFVSLASHLVHCTEVNNSMKVKTDFKTSQNTVQTTESFLKRTEAYASSLKCPATSGLVQTQSGISSMATIHNTYATMSNAMAPEITFLNDYEFDENDVFDSDSSLIEFSNVKSDSSEYQNNHWANY